MYVYAARTFVAVFSRGIVAISPLIPTRAEVEQVEHGLCRQVVHLVPSGLQLKIYGPKTLEYWRMSRIGDLSLQLAIYGGI